MQVESTKALGNVLVTGGTGFIGSYLVKRLVEGGNRVRVLDNCVRRDVRRLGSYLDRIEYVEGDVVDSDRVLRVVEGIDTLFHLAFINGTENFYRFPEKVLGVGVKGALNTLDAALRCDVKRYIVTSSSEVYQQPTRVPTPEDERIVIPDIKNPRFSYSGAKIITELLALHYPAKSKLETVICRPHNVYGPDMGAAHVIPQMILRMKDLSRDFSIREIELPIQGTGEETRAFCYIHDAVGELIQCAVKGKNREIYHIGTEEEIAIRELAARLAQLLGIRISLKRSEGPLGGTTRRCPSIAKIRDLGFEPEWSLTDGLKETVAWYLRAEFKLQDERRETTG